MNFPNTTCRRVFPCYCLYFLYLYLRLVDSVPGGQSQNIQAYPTDLSLVPYYAVLNDYCFTVQLGKVMSPTFFSQEFAPSEFQV